MPQQPSIPNASGGGPGAPPVEPLWRMAPPNRGSWSLSVRFATAWCGLLLLAAVLVWLSTWLRPPHAASVVMLGAGYQTNLAVPHNVYGWRGLNDLAALIDESGEFRFWDRRLMHPVSPPVELRAGVDWSDLLSKAKERQVVVCMSMHGGVDSQGAYLLPTDCTAANTEHNRLRLAAVLEALGKLPDRQQKLLVLDATQITADWSLGMLHNDFARLLNELEPKIVAIPNLVVISASDVNQRSWVCQEWGRTIFYHYLLEGLKGAAADSNHNGRIDAWELFTFTDQSVRHWTVSNRNTWQTPVLLPSGNEGRRRARQMDLAMVTEGYVAPDARETPTFSPPDELTSTWQQHQALAAESPPPQVYTPHLWRRYQATVLRIEQLSIAGDRESATQLARSLAGLKQQIVRARQVRLSSLGNSFSMPAAAGYTVSAAAAIDPDSPLDQMASQVLNNLWNASPDDFAKKWADAKTEVGNSALSMPWFRLRLAELLVHRAAEDPANHLATACALLKLTDDPLHPRAIEAHLAVMLERDLPDGTMAAELAALVQLALQTRIQAERVALAVVAGSYAYSEQVRPWIADDLAAADDARRKAEDLIFAGNQQWPRAQKQLTAAGARYAAVAQSAATVRDAIALRNEVVDMLPYLTLWLARHERANGMPLDRDLVGVDEVEQLWTLVHQLSGLLESPAPAAIHQAPVATTDVPKPQSLADLSENVRQKFRALGNEFHQWWNELASTDVSTSWFETEMALVVPRQDATERIKAITNARNRSRQLLVETTGKAVSSPAAPADGGEPKDNTPATGVEGANPPVARGPAHADLGSLGRTQEQTMADAQRQGRLALAVIGRQEFDRLSSGGQETFDQIRHRIDVFPVEQDWWNSLVAIGDEVGSRFQAMANTVQDEVRSAASAERDAAAKIARRASRLSRLMDLSGSLPTDDNAAALERGMLLEDLLLWLAQRTIDDHWYAEDPAAQPYYQLAAGAFVADAQRMDSHQDRVNQMRATLAQPGNLVVDGLRRVRLTTEQQYEMQYNLHAGDKAYVPPGFPVVWAEAGENLKLTWPPAGQRTLRELGPNHGSGILTCTVQSPLLDEAERQPPLSPKMTQSSLSLTVLYRGQRIQTSTDFELYLLPEVAVVELPSPDRASLAVRADDSLDKRFGDGSGAVAIVLDCSGSMGPPRGQKFDATTKYAEATAALRQVLPQIPRGVTLSIWIFGQAVGSQRTVPQAEQTVTRVVGPLTWDPVDAGLLAQTMQKISYPQVQPWNESPVLHAMLSAKDDLIGHSGPKTLVVLTDGIDNRFSNDTRLKQLGNDIPAVLRRSFANAGITVSVVAFKVADHEQDMVQQQFRAVEQLDPPGHWFRVNETAQLAQTFHAALRQPLRYWLEDFDNRLAAGVPSGGLDVSRVGANDRWFPGVLPPASYRLRIPTVPPVAGQVALDRGDLLLLNLLQDERGIHLQRIPWAQSTFAWRPMQTQGDWVATLLQNQLTRGGGLEMLVALERQVAPDESWLAVPRPRNVWLEVDPPTDTTPRPAIRWNYLSGYPAPAWSIASGKWPNQFAAQAERVAAVVPPNGATGPALLPPPNPAGQSMGTRGERARLRLWWNPDQQLAPVSALDRNHDFQGLVNLAGRTVRVAGGEVTIDSVVVETHLVETRSGQREQQSCLTIRLTYDPDHKIWARPWGVATAGAEHRFYHTIGKYTGLFWPVTADQASDTLQRLELFSIDDFKDQAQRRGFFIDLNNLPLPNPGDTRPQSPVDWN